MWGEWVRKTRGTARTSSSIDDWFVGKASFTARCILTAHRVNIMKAWWSESAGTTIDIITFSGELASHASHTREVSRLSEIHRVDIHSIPSVPTELVLRFAYSLIFGRHPIIPPPRAVPK